LVFVALLAFCLALLTADFALARLDLAALFVVLAFLPAIALTPCD
jgi:hypothetical protein